MGDVLSGSEASRAKDGDEAFKEPVDAICPRCGTANPSVAHFCIECGMRLKEESSASAEAHGFDDFMEPLPSESDEGTAGSEASEEDASVQPSYDIATSDDAGRHSSDRSSSNGHQPYDEGVETQC